MVQHLALFPLFSLQLILDPPARLLAVSSKSMSKTCRIWYAFFFLSQVRNTCLSMCIYIMQLVLVLFVGAVSEQWQCFLQSPTLDYLIFADQLRSSQEIEAVTLGFLSSELTFSSSVDRTRGELPRAADNLIIITGIRTPLPQRFPSCTAYLKSMNIFIKFPSPHQFQIY